MNDLIVNISLQNIPLQKRANLLTFQQNLFHPKINGEDPLRSEGPSSDEISRVGPLESAHVAADCGPVIGRQPGPRQLAALWLAGRGLDRRGRDPGPVPGPGVTHRGAGILMGSPDTGPAQVSPHKRNPSENCCQFAEAFLLSSLQPPPTFLICWF